MTEILHTAQGRPIGVLPAEVSKEDRFKESLQLQICAFRPRPVSAPVDCKKFTSEGAVVVSEGGTQVTAKYYSRFDQNTEKKLEESIKVVRKPSSQKPPEKTFKNPEKPVKITDKSGRKYEKESRNIPRNPEKANRYAKSHQHSKTIQNDARKTEKIKQESVKGLEEEKSIKKNTVNRQKHTQKPEIKEEKEKKPKITPECKEIIKQAIEKERQFKQQQQSKHEQEEEVRNLKEYKLYQIQEEAKESRNRSQQGSFRHKVAWGVDQRKFEEQKFEPADTKKAEYRERVRSEGRKRIGLGDIVEIKPHMANVSSKPPQIEEEPAKKKRELNPEMQEYIKTQKKRRFIESKMKEEEIARKQQERLEKLKELQMLARERAQRSIQNDNKDVSKNKKISAKLKKAAAQMKKERIAHESADRPSTVRIKQSDSSRSNPGLLALYPQQNMTDSEPIEGNSQPYSEDFEEDASEAPSHERQLLNAQFRNSQFFGEHEVGSNDDEEEKTFDEEQTDDAALQSFEYATGSYEEDFTGEEFEEGSEEGSGEEFEEGSEEGSGEEFEEGSEEEFEGGSGEEFEEGSEEEKSFYEDMSSNEFDRRGFNVKEQQKINLGAKDIHTRGPLKKPSSDINEAEKKSFAKKSNEINRPVARDELSVNELINEYPPMGKRHLEQHPGEKRDQSKQEMRAKLASFHTKPMKKAAVSIPDDLDVKFADMPGLLYMSNLADSDPIRRNQAATRIQAAYRGHRARNEVLRIKLKIPSKYEVKTDIDNLLLQYYPEAFVPDDHMFTPNLNIDKITAESKIEVVAEKPPALRKEVYIGEETDEYNLVSILIQENFEISADDYSQDFESETHEKFESVSKSRFSELSSSKRVESPLKESIAEEIVSSRKEDSVDRYSKNLLESKEEDYSEDFESLSSSLKKSISPPPKPQDTSIELKSSMGAVKSEHFAPESSSRIPPLPGKFNVDQLSSQLISEIENLEKIRQKEAQLESLVGEYQQWLEQHKRQAFNQPSNVQDWVIQELQRSKQEDMARFQAFTQEMMRVQRDSIQELASALKFHRPVEVLRPESIHSELSEEIESETSKRDPIKISNEYHPILKSPVKENNELKMSSSSIPEELEASSDENLTKRSAEYSDDFHSVSRKTIEYSEDFHSVTESPRKEDSKSDEYSDTFEKTSGNFKPITESIEEMSHESSKEEEKSEEDYYSEDFENPTSSEPTDRYDNKQPVIDETIEDEPEQTESEIEEEPDSMRADPSEITDQLFTELLEDALALIPSLFNVDAFTEALFGQIFQDSLSIVPVLLAKAEAQKVQIESSRNPEEEEKEAVVEEVKAPEKAPKKKMTILEKYGKKSVDTSPEAVLNYTDQVINIALKKNILPEYLSPIKVDPVDQIGDILDSCDYIPKVQILPKVLPNNIYEGIEQTWTNDDAQRTYNKLIFDGINETLNSLRPYGLDGEPPLWSKAYATNKPLHVSEYLPLLKDKMKEWASFKAGRIGAKYQVKVNKEDSAFLKKTNEKLHLLHINGEDWSRHEEQEIRVTSILGELIVESLIDETYDVLTSR